MTLAEDELRALIEQAQGGDRRAFDELCGGSREALLGTIRNMIGIRARGYLDPDDVLQDTLTSAWASIARFRWQGERSFLRWLEGIARNRVLHLSRRELRRAELLELHRPEHGHVPPSRGLRRAERFERLKSAVNALRPEHREVIRLARLEARSIREIAAELQKSESAVKSLLLRAMTALREVMSDTESFALPPDCRLDRVPEDCQLDVRPGNDGDAS